MFSTLFDHFHFHALVALIWWVLLRSCHIHFHCPLAAIVCENNFQEYNWWLCLKPLRSCFLCQLGRRLQNTIVTKNYFVFLRQMRPLIPLPHFRKVMLQILSEIHDRSIVYDGNKFAKLRRHASRVHFAKIHFRYLHFWKIHFWIIQCRSSAEIVQK